MRRPMLRVASLLVPLICAVALPAARADGAPPELCPYQGRLVSSVTGQPLNGSFDMVLKLYDGATLLLTDSHVAANAVPVVDGIYVVKVGEFVSPGAEATLGAVFKNHSAVTMSVTINGETLSPAVDLLSSTYSLNAAALNGQSASYYLTAGNLTGTLPDARLSSNVALLGTAQTFSGAKTFGSAITASGGVTGLPAPAAASDAATKSYVDSLGGSGAPAGAAYLTLALDPALSSERTLAVAAPLTLSDGGANGSATLGLGTVGIANGGTGATTASAARTNLGAAASGANADIAALTGLNAQNALSLSPFGTAAGNTGEARFLELAANGTNYVGFKAPDSIAANKIWTLPAADGTSGQVLSTNGAGALSWVASGGSGGFTKVVGATFTGVDPQSASNNSGVIVGTYTVTGAAVGDEVLVGFTSPIAGVVYSGCVTAANQVSVLMINHSGFTKDPNPGTLNIVVVAK